MPIVLLTDFGTRDAYVGILKGVISQIAPQVPVIDLNHEIPSFDVDAAAFMLYQSYSYFPEGSIFVTVVDPGVGGECRRVLVKTENYFFVGPDNGYLSLVLMQEKMQHAIHLTHEAYFLNTVSSTFHGRDIFAPIAAQLAEGVDFQDMGMEIYDLKHSEHLMPRKTKGKIEGKILSIDKFGNAITNFSRDFIRSQIPNLKFSLKVGTKKLTNLKSHYAEGKDKIPFLLFGSSGFLELCVNQGSAEKILRFKKGQKVSILF